MSKIQSIIAREIFNSHANPTIEVKVQLNDGVSCVSSIESGIKKMTYEAQYLYDEDPNRFDGMGVTRAVESVNNEIAPKIVGMEAHEQQKVDRAMIELDGTQNKMKLGANSILAVSQAVAKTAAKSALLTPSLYLRQLISQSNQPHKIPTPMFNLIEGGKHSDGGLNFQEFLVIPATSNSFSRSLEIGLTLYQKLQAALKDGNQATSNAQEGGFSPKLPNNAEALRMLRTVISTTSYSYLKDVFMGVDVAANGMLNNRKYTVKDKNGLLDDEDLIEIYHQMFTDYSLVYFEDPFGEDDWEGWKKMYAAFSSKSLIAGDDITCTNPYRLQTALNNNVVSAIVIKPTQIGTVTESLAVVEIARFKQLKLIVSSRSGATDDDFIADFAVAIDSDYVKFGAPSRERIGKYNRLLEIEKENATVAS